MSGVTVDRGQGKDDGAVLLGIGEAVEILSPIEACLLAKQLLEAAGLGESRRELADEDFDDFAALVGAARSGDEAGMKLVLREAAWQPLVHAAAATTGAAVDMAIVARLVSFGGDVDPDELRAELRAEQPVVLRKAIAIARAQAAGLLED